MSISWGKQDRFKFTECGVLSSWAPPAIPAVYAVTYRKDPLNRPKSHTILYFGEAEDLYQHTPAQNKRVVDVWLYSGGNVEELHVFMHPMYGSTPIERSKVKNRLVSEYQPHINGF